MALEDALEECFQDLSVHQAGMVAGAQEALLSLLERLDPETLEARSSKMHPRMRFFTNQQALCWETYRTLFADLVQAEDVFDHVFGEAFTRGYQRTTKQAEAAHRKPETP